MTRKEIKNLAIKIAKVERQMNSATELAEKQKLEVQLFELCSKVKNLDDMVAVDDMVMDILSKDS